MSDEKISQMPDAGTLTTADIIPLVRTGNNLSTSPFKIAALAGGQAAGGVIVHDVDCRSTSPTVVLPTVPADGETHLVKDAYGAAALHPPMVTAGGTILIDASPTFPPNGIWPSWASFGFRWSVAVGKWLVQ